MYTNNGKGNAELSNLPRKLNIALSPSRDDFPHTHINDVGLVAVRHPETGEVGHLLFSSSLLVGCAALSLPPYMWIVLPGPASKMSSPAAGGGTAAAVVHFSFNWERIKKNFISSPSTALSHTRQCLSSQIGFNLEVGGYFSIKRNAVSMDGDTFIRQDQVVPYCKAMLEVFRCVGLSRSIDSLFSLLLCVAPAPRCPPLQGSCFRRTARRRHCALL